MSEESNNDSDNKKHKGWIAAVAAIAALLGALGVNQFFPRLVEWAVTPKQETLLYSGFYREQADPKDDSVTYLRFAGDGSVMSASVQAGANAGAVASWFNTNAKYAARGTYVITQNGQLEASVKAITGISVGYTGRLKDGVLHLHSKSSNGHESDATYTFMQTPGTL
ncbi:MAG: hypothetical protein RI964_470 [Pseudomonadota bacterium]|jgi:hypothetical protein